MKLVDGNHNWHNYHKHRAQDNIYEKRFLEAFTHIKLGLDTLGVACFNATEDSALTVFPFVDFEETLKW
jgi:hypothetical protein